MGVILAAGCPVAGPDDGMYSLWRVVPRRNLRRCGGRTLEEVGIARWRWSLDGWMECPVLVRFVCSKRLVSSRRSGNRARKIAASSYAYRSGTIFAVGGVEVEPILLVVNRFRVRDRVFGRKSDNREYLWLVAVAHSSVPFWPEGSRLRCVLGTASTAGANGIEQACLPSSGITPKGLPTSRV